MSSKQTSFKGNSDVGNSIDDIMQFNPDIAQTPSNKTSTDVSFDANASKEPENNNLSMYGNNILKELEALNPAEKMLPIFTCGEAQLFFCDPNGKTESSFEKHKLILSKVEGDLAETVFLTVGDWIYPLYPGLSPCFRSEERLFVFPDIHSQLENSTVMILLPVEESKAFHQILTDLLSGFDEYREKRSLAVDGTAPNIASPKSSYIAQALVNASSALADRIDSFTAKAVTRIEPKPEAQIDPGVQKYIHTAANFVDKTAQSSGFIASKFGQAVAAMGRYISPYASNKVKGYLPANAVQTVGSCVQEFGEIYSGLEDSVSILTNSVANNAVKVMERRHGVQAGQVSNDVLSIIGNIYAIRRDLNIVRPKSFVKSVVKSTGGAIAEDWRNQRRNSQT